MIKNIITILLSILMIPILLTYISYNVFNPVEIKLPDNIIYKKLPDIKFTGSIVFMHNNKKFGSPCPPTIEIGICNSKFINKTFIGHDVTFLKIVETKKKVTGVFINGTFTLQNDNGLKLEAASDYRLINSRKYTFYILNLMLIVFIIILIHSLINLIIFLRQK